MTTTPKRRNPAGGVGYGACEVMHPKVFAAFDELLAPLAVTGAVLEIGASPDHQSLLRLPALAGAGRRIGVGGDGAGSGEGFEIVSGDANHLSAFEDGAFDLVVCNATLEHDPRFWLLLAEARRVTTSGGWLAFGAPGYAAMGSVPGTRQIHRLAALPWIGRRWRAAARALDASSATLGQHDFPGDYYRFSERAMVEVILQGLDEIRTMVVMNPPRVLGLGRKP